MLGGKSVRITRSMLLSGQLPEDLEIVYGAESVPRHPLPGHRLIGAEWRVAPAEQQSDDGVTLLVRDGSYKKESGEGNPITTVAEARTSLKARPTTTPRRADIMKVAAFYEFEKTSKQAKKYAHIDSGEPGSMPPMSYTVATKEIRVVTVTADGKETENVAAPGDIIMSGPSGENYVVKAAKFGNLYDGQIGTTIIPNQTAREVTRYTGSASLVFTAPWGEDMVVKPGDYLVKDGDAGYYRIAKAEYEDTYNAPGIVSVPE